MPGRPSVSPRAIGTSSNNEGHCGVALPLSEGTYSCLDKLACGIPRPALSTDHQQQVSAHHHAMPSSVPVAGVLADIYPLNAVGGEVTRWNRLLSRFQDLHDRLPAFVARSPGRINIIGEHIDYSLYSVLPMAITSDVLVAVTATPVAEDADAFAVRLANVDDARFASSDVQLPLGGDVDIDATRFEWTNYFKSELRGALALLRRKRGPAWRPCHLDVLVDGNVPVGGGLSSSAAFVTASALAVPDLEQRFLSSFPVRAERFKLRQRALHVFTEAFRVIKFLTYLERPLHMGASDTTPFNLELGALMNETQDSCRDLFECSCPEIDHICRVARAAGAYGSRMTGAGWGSCSVHLVPADKVADIKDALEREYAGKELTKDQREVAMVVSRPAGGSALYYIEGPTVGDG